LIGESMEIKELDIYKMELHEFCRIPLTDFYILRVPGGWIYQYEMLGRNVAACSVFVPFDNGFQLERMFNGPTTK